MEEFVHMKERPVLFTPENAQKVFCGSKSQTRRIVKPQPEEGMKILGPEMFTPCRTDKNGEMYPGEDVFGVYSDDGEWGVACPYGVPGDRLWVRESLYARGDYVTYSDGTIVSQGGLHWPSFQEKKVIPSIHMPRWACRTVVEITEIRVQRVQEISEDDARAEGCSPVVHEDGAVDCGTRKTTFRQLWGSINGPGSWDANPWVWAISFKKVQA